MQDVTVQLCDRVSPLKGHHALVLDSGGGDLDGPLSADHVCYCS